MLEELVLLLRMFSSSSQGLLLSHVSISSQKEIIQVILQINMKKPKGAWIHTLISSNNKVLTMT